jgi:hypothetical protein
VGSGPRGLSRAFARTLSSVGLGLLVGAVLQPAGAQVRDTSVVPKRDTAAVRDTVPRRDSVVHRDTIKAGLAQSELPVLADPSGSYHWTRAAMFSTGALTLQDLLDRTPGLTGLRTNWIPQPMMSAYLGDLRRVRVSIDGFQLDELEPTMRGVWDLSQIPIWGLDDLVVERSASEVRIVMRTWRVDRTTPVSRTDIYTGDQATNLYRGVFGRRYENGEVLQLAGQQYSATPGPRAESSDHLGFMSRVGIARRLWTADVVMLRQSRQRGRNFTQSFSDTMPGTESTRSDAYFRFAWTDTARGWWTQGLAGASVYTWHAPELPANSTLPDSGVSRSQYVWSSGYSRGAMRASFTQRFLLGSGRHVATPSGRLSFDAKRLTISAYGEGRGLDSTRRFDVSAVARPVGFAFVGGSFGTEVPLADSAGSPVFSRVEAGVRVRDLWLSGGLMRRDPVKLDAGSIVLPNTPAVQDSSATATFASVRGRVWKAIYLDAHAVRWSDTAAAYRPQYQTRTEVYLSTARLDRFPTGNFHVRMAAVHEYRSTMLWPDSTGFTRVSGFRTWSTLLQFKIVSAEIFWNYRNTLNHRYEQIPGYRMPRLSSVYGVRWEFWN